MGQNYGRPEKKRVDMKLWTAALTGIQTGLIPGWRREHEDTKGPAREWSDSKRRAAPTGGEFDLPM